MFSKRTYRRNKPKQSNWLESNDQNKETSFIPPIQTKLNIGKPGDVYEKEADKTADEVVSKSPSQPDIQKIGEEKEEVQTKGVANNITPFVQKQEEPKEEVQARAKEEEVQTKCADCAEEEAVQQKEEEEEAVQPKEEKEEAVQAQEEEEEAVQPKEEKEEAVQAQEEEEAVQSKEEEEEAIQAQETEEEAVQPKEKKDEAVQAQETEEEAIQSKEKEEEVQQKSNLPAPSGGSIESKLSAHRGSGYRMDSETKGEMEGSFSNDFSNVRIHTGGYAQEMNKELKARAFTNGNDIYFNSGEYKPQSKEGKHLLAHELTHTIQQKGVTNRVNKQAQPNPQQQCTPGAIYAKANSTIFFNRDSTNLRSDSTINLIHLINEVNQYMNASGGTGIILIHGYASEEGSPSHNQTLSRNRAQYVKTLLAASGLVSSRMIPLGHGEDTSRPALEDNRRVQITYLPPAICNPCRFNWGGSPILLDTRTPAHYGSGNDFRSFDFPSLSITDSIKIAPWVRDSDASLESTMNRELTLLAGSMGSTMTSHFRGGSGSTYLHSSSSLLGLLTFASPTANAVLSNIEAQLRAQFRVMQATSNFDASLFSLTSVPHLHFTFSDPLPLKAVIGGSQGHEVYLTGMRSLGNTSPCLFEIDVKLVLFDDFGVDTSDLYSPSLIAFWILQHFRAGNRPFVNRLEIDRTFTF